MAEDGQGVRLGAPNTHLPDRLRERTTRSSRRRHCQPVGPRAHMTRLEGSGGRGGQQQPAATPEAPEHMGDLAMASAEWAAADMDEEEEDIH